MPKRDLPLRILTCGHSLQAERQRRFYRYLASLGHEVKLLTPDFGTRVRGLQEIVDEFNPSHIRVEDEKDGIAIQVTQLHTKARLILFSWENLPHMQTLSNKVLGAYDLIIPGCPGSHRLLTSRGLKNVYEGFIPQVPIDETLFKPMPEIEKAHDLIYVGGRTVNKGIDLIEKTVRELDLSILWVGKKRGFDILPYEGFPTYGDDAGFVPYKELSKYYNQAKILVIASRDTPIWIEQWVFAIQEALLCGLPVIASDAGEIPEVWGNCPSVRIVPQGFYAELKEAISESLRDWEPNLEGREFVIKHYSREVIANKLLKAFS